VEGPPLQAHAESILTGPLREAAMRAALHVAERLKDPRAAERAAAQAAAQSQFPEFSRWSPPSVAQGNAGLALLWAYLDSCFPDREWDVVGKRHLEEAVRSIDLESTVGTGLFSGLSGLAFAGSALSRDGARYRRMLASLDQAIAAETVALAGQVRASNGLSVGDFDVISGLTGIGAYLLCRRAEPHVESALAGAVDALIAQALSDDVPPRWFTPAHLLYDDVTRQMYPHGNLNCGLAHGIPGPLAFLSLVRLSGLAFDRLDDAIVAIAQWLCANRQDDVWGANWPAAVHLEEARDGAGRVVLRPGDPKVAPGGPSRTAWCYGSPGVARALWLAGQALDRDAYRELAVGAMEAVFRRPIPARMIGSPTFCHGVAGLLAITMRFARETREPIFFDQSRRLAEQLVRSFQPDSLLGFRCIEYGNNQTDQPGLLDGAAGVAIVLLAACTGIEPAWDRVFLLS
jgi:lantibiotic modifying enzyme